MPELLVVEISDDEIIAGSVRQTRPPSLTPQGFDQWMQTWLAAHDYSSESDELRVKAQAALTPDFLTELGSALFQSVFHGDVLDQYRAAPNSPITLDLPDDLRTLPWELMRDDGSSVAQTRGILRLVRADTMVNAVPRSGPLRVLALLSMPVLDPSKDPGDSAQPYVGDVDSYAAMFRTLHGEGFPAAFTIVQHATRDDLRKGVEDGPDVLYFDGHGNSTGLLFDDGCGRVRWTDDYTLRDRLRGSSLQLVVTNSCSTASQLGAGDPVAVMLVRTGVPIVVGMQAPIGDFATQRFAEAFFGSLARGKTPLDAVKGARHAVVDSPEGRVQAWEWATPALYASHSALDALQAPLTAPGDGDAVVTDITRERLTAAPGAGPALPSRPAQFVGRREEIVKTLEALSQTKVTILYGARGIGKTTLAREVVHRAARRFDRIVWVRARVEASALPPSTATADPMASGRLASAEDLLTRVAEGLGIDSGAGGRALLAAIGDQLETSPTLLVLDNLDTFAAKGDFAETSVLRDLLAVLPASSRSLLTVAGDLDSPGRPIHVQGLPPQIAARLAYLYAREIGVDISTDDAAVIGLSTQGHPMAIRFAIGLLARGENRRDVIDGLSGRTGRPVEEVLNYVMGSAIDAASDDAKLLFTLASLFPSPLLRDVLAAGSLWGDRDRFLTALDEAVDYILLESVYDGEYVLIQELPRSVARRLDLPLPRGPEHGMAMVDWARKPGYETLFCDLVDAWTEYCQPRGHLEEWIPAGREALDVAQQFHDPRREIVARNNLGMWCICTGALPEGLEHFARCETLAEQEQMPTAAASVLGNMGNIYADQGEPARALESYGKAYEIGERLNNPQLMANQLGNMGNIYARQGEPERALECHQKAYEIDVRLGNPQGQAEDLGNMGMIYADQGEPARALESYGKALEIGERLNNPQLMANALGNMGNIYARQGEPACALESYGKAYEIGERLNNPQLMANQLGNMGLIYIRQGKLRKAREDLERSRDLYAKAGIRGQGPDVVAAALDGLPALENIEKEVGPEGLKELLSRMSEASSGEGDTAEAEDD